MGLFTNYNARSDEQLMVLLQSGDHRAFSKLYDRYAQRLMAFFKRMLWLDQEAAEDALQDLFTKIIERPELFKAEYKFQPWVFQVAANMCKNRYRKKSFEEEFRLKYIQDGIELPGIERALDGEISMDILHNALQLLSEDKRTLFLLRYQQELSIEELSTMFDIPEGTVKSRLFNIRKYLAEVLNNETKEMQKRS